MHKQIEALSTKDLSREYKRLQSLTHCTCREIVRLAMIEEELSERSQRRKPLSKRKKKRIRL